jgi:hypothetical protein
LIRLLVLILSISSLWGYEFSWQSHRSQESFRKKERVPVSLGPHCALAFRFREFNVRHAAFPFDWIYSEFPGLYELIKTDFKDFLNPDNLVKLESGWVEDQKYKITFPHDFTKRSSIDWNIYNSVYKKYCRRVARFYRFLEEGVPVYLMRVKMKKEEAFRLYDLLKNKFPKSDFILVSINENEGGSDEDWGHDKILHFSIEPDPRLISHLKEAQPDFVRIFQSLDLIK